MIPGPCQVRSRTESPCPHGTEVEILGVAFCGPCARAQEAYFAIGELTQEEAKGPRGMSLAETLEGMLRGAQVVRKASRQRGILVYRA
jgi:hypothetical protein